MLKGMLKVCAYLASTLLESVLINPPLSQDDDWGPSKAAMKDVCLSFSFPFHMKLLFLIDETILGRVRDDDGNRRRLVCSHP